MTSIKWSREVQLGRETTAGTAVEATTIWRGPAVSPEDVSLHIRPDENIGVAGWTSRQYSPQTGAKLALPATDLTFEQSNHVFEASLKLVGTGVVDTGGSGHVYTYPLPYSCTPPTIKTYSIKAGNCALMERMEYAFVTEFSISGKAAEVWKISSNWAGKQVTDSARAALTVTDVEEAMFEMSKIYCNNVSTGMGNTQLTGTVIGVDLAITTGWAPRHTADGAKTLHTHEYTGISGSATLKMLHNSQTETLRDLFQSDTPVALRVLIEGSNLATAGTFTKKTIRLDLPGVFTSFSPANDDDAGYNVVSAVMAIGYDATIGDMGEIVVVNELATVP